MTAQGKEPAPAQDNHFEQDRLKNRLEAYRFLNGSGFKRGKTQFFDDCRDGLIPMAKDGSISRYDVLEYGRNLKSEIMNRVPFCPFIERAIKKAVKKQSRIQQKQIEALREEIPEIMEKCLVDWLTKTPDLGEKEPEVRILFKDTLTGIFSILNGDDRETLEHLGL